MRSKDTGISTPYGRLIGWLWFVMIAGALFNPATSGIGMPAGASPLDRGIHDVWWAEASRGHAGGSAPAPRRGLRPLRPCRGLPRGACRGLRPWTLGIDDV